MAFRDRMERVAIENTDWENLIPYYDAPGTVWFLDPPYTSCHDTAYACEDADNIPRMADRIRSLKGSWVLTFNDCEEIRREFPSTAYDITRHTRKVTVNNAGGGRPGKPYAELIIRPKNQPLAST